MRVRNRLARGLIGGIVGGAAGLAAMRLYWQGARAVTGHDPRTETRQEQDDLDDISIGGQRAEEGESSTAAAGRMADEAITGDPPGSREKKRRISQAFHWGFGMSMAALYALSRGRVRPPDLVGGLAFGTAVWATADELMVPLLGLTRGPTAYPFRQHVHRLGAHLAYGMAASGATQYAVRAMDGGPTRRERIWSAARRRLGRGPKRALERLRLDRIRGTLERAV